MMPRRTSDPVFQLFPSLFSDYGFQNVNLTAIGLVAPLAPNANVINVAAGTPIDATVRSLLLGPSSQSAPTGATIGTLGSVVSLPTYQQAAESISLTALPLAAGFNTAPAGATAVGDVAIGAGAAITTGPGGSIALTGLGSILVDGTLPRARRHDFDACAFAGRGQRAPTVATTSATCPTNVSRWVPTAFSTSAVRSLRSPLHKG